LIGWGANARAFARRLLQGGARVRVYSAHASVSELRSAQVEPAALAEVLTADIVSLHRGLNPSTHHGLDGSALARLRPGAVLINVARGALIDPDALLGRLRRGDVFACLDTFEEEPLPASHPLRRLPNVFLTAHIGGGSADMHAAAAAEVVAKVARYLSGERTGVITAAQVDSMT
jgi:phosphoglycerate dehydrogenase-like enzyme